MAAFAKSSAARELERQARAARSEANRRASSCLLAPLPHKADVSDSACRRSQRRRPDRCVATNRREWDGPAVSRPEPLRG